MLVDIHVHTSALAPQGPTRPNGETYATPDELIGRYDARGIRLGVILPSVNPECSHLLTTNEEALGIVERHPGRFVAFCNLDPRFVTNSTDADLAPLLQHYRARGCRGVGEVCANLWFDNPLVVNLFRHCEASGLPVTFHVATRAGGTYGLIDDLGLPRLEKALARFPGLTFLGHSQAFWSEISGDVTEETRGGYPPGPVVPGGRIVELMRRYPNLHGDLSAGSGHNAVSRDPDFGYAFLEEFQDRLYFGTDICAPSNETPLVDFLADALREGRLSETAYEQIAWRNAARLLSLELNGG